MVNTWTFVRTGAALSCLALAISCGDDGGGDDSNGNEETGGNELTLEEALETDGTSTSEERAELLFPAACEEQEKCKAIPSCATSQLDVFESMRAARSTACLDATLDLYACFASEACAEYDEVCNDFGQAQKDACGEE